MNYDWDNLDTPLLRFADEPDSNSFSYRKSFESLICFGNTGSGKSSGVLAKLMREYMHHGYGMLLLTAKPDDAETYKKYAEEAGRSHEIIELKPRGRHSFNFMQYESTANSGVSYARNLQDLLTVTLEAGQERSEKAENDPFWRESQEMLIKNSIQLLLMAYNEVTIPELYAVVQSTPQAKDQMAKKVDEEPTAFEKAMAAAKKQVKEQLDKWHAVVGEYVIANLSEEEYRKMIDERVPNVRALKLVRDFFMESLYSISEKTRGIILLSFTNFLGRLLDEPVYSLFCSNKESTVVPEDCIDFGKIVIVNLPVALYNRIGQDVQIMVKYIFQKAWQRRDLNWDNRPLAIVADEAQFFIHNLDATLLSTSRSSRISTVYLSQNLPSFYANLGGSAKAQSKVDALLSLLSTKIFLCNGCVKTNRWASDLIGKAYTEDVSSNSQFGKGFSFGEGSQYSLEDIVRPEAFSKLRCGGPPHFTVEGYIHMQGLQFNNGFNHKKIKFKQVKN